MADMNRLNEKGTRKYRRRWKQLYEDASNWRGHWRELNEYLFPRRGAFLYNEDEKTGDGRKKRQKIINSRASLARRVLGSGLMAGLTSPARPWFRLTVDNEEAMETAGVRDWLHDVRAAMLRVFQKSNFYGAARSLYGELGCFGFNAMLIEEDLKKVIRCRPMTIGEAYISLDHEYRPNGLYRKYWLTVEQIVKEFAPLGKDDKPTQKNPDGTGVNDAVWAAYTGGRIDERYQVFHVIEQRTLRNPKDPGNRSMPFKSIYFLDKDEGDQFLRVSGYRSMPFVAPRWDTIGTDTYGDCPGMEALADVKMLQKMETDKLMALDKEVNPPMNAPVSMRDTGGTIVSGGVNYIDTQQGQQGFTPAYQVKPDLNGLAFEIDRVENRINEHFFVPLFMSIINENKQMTATETAQRVAEKMQQIGPVIERLQSEFLDVIIERTFTIMESLGMIPEPPQEIQGNDFNIEYISLLAQAQQMYGTVTIEQLAGFVANVAGVSPEILDKVDFDQMLDQYADDLGAPPELIRTDDVVQQIRDGRAQQAAQAQAMETGGNMAQGAKLLSEAKLEGDSALDALMGGVAG